MNKRQIKLSVWTNIWEIVVIELFNWIISFFFQGDVWYWTISTGHPSLEAEIIISSFDKDPSADSWIWFSEITSISNLTLIAFLRKIATFLVATSSIYQWYIDPIQINNIY